MNTVENFILELDGQQKAIVSILHNHLSEVHELDAAIRWSVPVYSRKKHICYLNPLKNGGVELAFARGYELSNEQQMLVKKGRKYVAGVDVFHIKEVNFPLLDQIIHEAIILDDL